jgi:PTS system mannose-specific IIA component
VTNIVVVSHGDFCRALIEAAGMIIGPLQDVHAVVLLPQDSPDLFDAKLEATLAGLEGQDTLILIDLFGGTPFNVSCRKVLLPNVECITGVNMAMLIEALSSRDSMSLGGLAAHVVEAGLNSIVNVKPLLCKKPEAGA